MLMPKVNLAVCGRFHYHNYAGYLDEAGVLERFYYSHRMMMNRQVFGVDRRRLFNAWIKEYLLRAFLIAFGGRYSDRAYALTGRLWQAIVAMAYTYAPLWHVALLGSEQRLIEKARRDGSLILGELLSSHPAVYDGLLAEESARLGICSPRTSPMLSGSVLAEAARCDHLLVASRFVAKSYLTRGFDSEKLHVIPYGVDLARFGPVVNEGGTRDDIFRVICVGAITPRKGQAYLLEAWRSLKLPRAELVLIGAISHDMYPVLQRYSGLFRHVPYVPNKLLRRWYGCASVFVLPSLDDGFGVVVTEAMACGLPVITTVNTGAADIVQHGHTGYVVPIRDAEAIACYLELLYREPKRRVALGRKALAYARAHLGWEQYALALMALYRGIGAARDEVETGVLHAGAGRP